MNKFYFLKNAQRGKNYSDNFSLNRSPDQVELSSDLSDYAEKKLFVSVINFLLSKRAELLKMCGRSTSKIKVEVRNSSGWNETIASPGGSE